MCLGPFKKFGLLKFIIGAIVIAIFLITFFRGVLQDVIAGN